MAAGVPELLIEAWLASAARDWVARAAVLVWPVSTVTVILSFLRQREQNHMFLKGSAGADDNDTLKTSEVSLLGKPVRMRICYLPFQL